MQQSQPLHADRHSSSFNFTLVLSLGITAWGLVTLLMGDPGGAPLFIVGGAVAAFNWFTTPGQYLVFQDHLVIIYGRPRTRHVSFRDVDQVEMMKFAFGPRVLVRLKKGGRLVLQPKDPTEFQSKFQGALESYLRNHPEPPQEQPGPPQKPVI